VEEESIAGQAHGYLIVEQVRDQNTLPDIRDAFPIDFFSGHRKKGCNSCG
jgi:hypothetical protein